ATPSLRGHETAAGAGGEEPRASSPARPSPPVIRRGDRAFAAGMTGQGKSEIMLHVWAVYRGQRLLVDVADHYQLGPAALAEAADHPPGDVAAAARGRAGRLQPGRAPVPVPDGRRRRHPGAQLPARRERAAARRAAEPAARARLLPAHDGAAGDRPHAPPAG